MVVPVDLLPHGFNRPPRIRFLHKLFRRELPQEIRAHVPGKVPGRAVPILDAPDNEHVADQGAAHRGVFHR